MFYLSEIEHTLRLPPHLLNLPLNVAIKGELEGLFLDKVVANLGLCVSFYDIKSIDGGFIFPSDGASTYTVKFRLIMFRPFVGEVISAKLLESTATGLRHPDNKKNQGAWIWEFQGENYAIDGVDMIRFKVNQVSYPSVPIEAEKLSNRFAPMVITGSLDADGLGPVSWWV